MSKQEHVVLKITSIINIYFFLGSEKKEEEDIFFKMFTNNFYEPFEIKNRISSIELGIWPSNEDVVWFPDKIANLHGKSILNKHNYYIF